MKKTLLGMVFALLLFLPAVSQDFAVEGTVRDSQTGEALIGASVVLHGTTTGAITDLDGNYSLVLSSGADTLVFSYVGMQTLLIAVNGRSRIDVQLNPATEELEEVMVVAYGTVTKEAYTGSAGVVKSETIEDRPVTSFEKALQGTTAGLQVTSSSGQPGASATVRIRGIGSLSAGSSPLYVVDGVPLSGGLSDINPNDIENLTVLKDAAAASLYGSRAANGVIIVTTKQGKKGDTRISFSSQTGVSSRISKGYQLMNSSQFYEHSWMGLYNQALLDGDLLEDARNFANDNVLEIVGFNPFAVDQPLDEKGKVIPGTAVLTDTDWRDLVYKTGFIQDYNLNVSGGNQDTRVFFSMGYFKDNGTTIGSDYQRFSGKLNATHKVNNFLTAGMSSHFSYANTNAPPAGSEHANPVRSAEVINAATPLMNPDGSYNWDNTAVFDFNPVALSEMDIYAYKGKRALLSSFLDFQLLPSLKFKTTGAIDYSDDDGLNHYNPYHGNGAGVNGRSTMSASNNMAWNISNILSWDRQGDLSRTEVLIGQEAHGERFSVLSAGVTDFSVAGKPDLVWGAEPETPSSSYSEWRMISYLGQARYSYDGRYYASASLRTDGSSRFGEDNKYGLFYSLGASWRITQESWFPSTNWVNSLKLRSSYGISGNNNIGNYASLDLYSSGANYGGHPGLAPAQPGNPALSWEKNTSLNLAMEFRLLKHLNGTFEYYHREADGLLYALPLSSGKGFGSIMTNLGAMQNQGLELTMDYDIIRKEGMNWSLGFNISRNRNEILNLSTDKINSGTKLLEVGGSMYQFYLKEWAGVNPDNGMPMWYTNAGSDDVDESTEPASSIEDPLGTGRYVTSEYNDAERVRLGTSLPDLYGGVNSMFNYGNFDLSFYFYFSIGGKVYNGDYATNMHDGYSPGYNLSTDALEAWTPDNKYTDVPRYVINSQDMGNQMSSRFLEDASYLRLKNISISYRIPDHILNKVKAKGMKVSLSAENIWTLSKFKGFDPEGALSGTTGSSIPGVKVVSLGLKLDI